MQKSIHIFISYAHEDESLKNQLIKHLALLQNQGFITEWHDHDISAGEDRAHEIDKHLNTASIILLLVSADFLASKYCYSTEMKRALERHRVKEAYVIPIILRPVDWHEAPFSNLQPLPQTGKPVTSWPGRHGRDSAFTDITMSIRALVKQLRSKNSSHNTVFLEKLQNEEQMFALRDRKQKILNQPIQSNFFFVFSQPLVNPDELYGREYERISLIEAVRRRTCLSIVGPLRIGKTWLLQYLLLIVQEECGPQFLAGYMDATMPNCATPYDFFSQVAELFDIVGLSAKDSPEHNLIHVLNHLAGKGIYPILCIDEFDAFMNDEFNNNFFLFLRAIAGNGLLTIITASRRSLHEIERPDPATSPFFGIFRYVELGPFHSKDAKQFIQLKSVQAGLTEQEQIQLLRCTQINKDQWYPWHLQLAGMMLLEDKNFAAQKDQGYYRPNDPIYWHDFEHRLKKQISMIEGKTYESSATEEPVLTKKDVQDVLSKLENQSFLQDCKFSGMYYILLRDKGDNGLSTRKGSLVYELFQSAFRNMMPTGRRSNSAVEWKLYNILYYRYFRYHLTTEKLMARLSIASHRQFYREQERAIQALLEEILKLEEASYLQWLSDK